MRHRPQASTSGVEAPWRCRHIPGQGEVQRFFCSAAQMQLAPLALKLMVYLLQLRV
jgi:hypothetical protein